MEGDHSLRLVHCSTPNTSKLLHVSANTEQKSEMHTQSTDVCSRLAAHPENTQLPLIVELVQLALVDRSDAQLSLDGRNERRSLEKGTGESLKSARKLRLSSGELLVESDNAHVLLSSTLLRFDETSGAVDAYDETSGDLGVEGSAVASLLHSRIEVSTCAHGK